MHIIERIFLKDSLNSLASQKFKDFEVILISNFSFDLSNYTNLNVRQIITDGIIGNYIYLGIKNAGSDIIVFMDDDDIFLPEKLEFIYNEFSSKNIGYIHNNSLFFPVTLKMHLTGSWEENQILICHQFL
ncbi:glycosyltransferase family A protein [Acidiplasma cupricumulans]|uniref:glycosyltransferase family A protein n=1 Tax=Acidiplasma cupricumulans TaxID=312540 RepID=UPI0007863DD3|nr:glycosyltransferase family A protein [Acidiplasma cupricumulans]